MNEGNKHEKGKRLTNGCKNEWKKWVCVFLLAGESVSADDGSGVDLLLHQFICTLQQLCSNDHLHTYTHPNLMLTLN